MIFANIKNEETVQAEDKTRLDASRSFVSPDEADITLMEIEPHTGEGFIDVSIDLYLDWEYTTPGTKTMTVRITTDGLPVTKTADIAVITISDDNLFSNDNELIDYEVDILSYLREGRSTYLDKHRASQKKILNELDSARTWKEDGTRYESADIINIQEFKMWSIFMTLKHIFEGISNSVDDIFSVKAAKYAAMGKKASQRGALRLDLDGNGVIDDDESPQDTLSISLVRR